jgi:pilus assembly protein Flp/PilA
MAGVLAMSKLVHFLKHESGVTAIEYALIAGGIALALVVVVGDVGEGLFAIFQSVEAAF